MIGGTGGLARPLAISAAVLGLLAPLAGSPYTAHHGQIDVEQLARIVRREADHVTAVELAQWIKDRRPGLRVVDVRSTPDFDAYHIPGAERVALDSLSSAGFRPSDTVVLYSEGGAYAAQGWVFLRALGLRDVYFLREGLYEWLDRVMDPTIAADAPEDTRLEFERVAALSRYFGGAPHTGERRRPQDVIVVPRVRADAESSAPALSQTGTAAAVMRVRRRGC